MDVKIAGGDKGRDEANASFGAVINTGAMMARMTNDYWKATPHRVIVPTAECARTDRYSIAFFVDPDIDEMIEVQEKYKGKDDASESPCATYHEPISSMDFILAKLKEMADAGKA